MATDASKTSLEGWKLRVSRLRLKAIALLKNFLRGMETFFPLSSAFAFGSLKNFLRGMETAIIKDGKPIMLIPQKLP